nr:SIR2 family protein [Cellulomonas hominis]
MQPADPGTDLLTLSFAIHSNPGAYAFLLGAGVSMSSGLPSAWDVRVSLASQVAKQMGAAPEDPISWFAETFGTAAEYQDMLGRLAPTPIERQKLLRGFFEPGDEFDVDVAPSTAHEAVARLVLTGSVRVIVTLNFDRLMEKALRAAGIEPVVIATPADVRGMDPLHTIRCCVIHLHGDYLNPTSMLNTTDELSTYHPDMAALLRDVLTNYGLVAAGWSGVYDPALREAIREHYPPRFTMTWVEPFEQRVEAVELRTAKHGTLIRADADTALGMLADAVTSMRARRARHPLTVTVAAETARRELSGRWVAIELHDTLGAEFTRLHALPELNPSDHPREVDVGIPAMIAAVREAAQVPAALVAAVAYWGSEGSNEWWLREIPRFGVNAYGDGLVKMLALPRHVGAMLYWSAGIASVAAGRFSSMYQLLTLRGADMHDHHEVVLASHLAEFVSYEALAPVLQAGLSLGPRAIEDAWQRFEVLRLATLTIENASFSRLRDEFVEAAGKVAQAVTPEERSSAHVAHQHAVAQLANLVPITAPHLFAARLDWNRGHRLPVAETLVRELDRQGAGHPMLGSRAYDLLSTRTALLATSVAAAQAVQRHRWRTDRVWLDSNGADV